MAGYERLKSRSIRSRSLKVAADDDARLNAYLRAAESDSLKEHKPRRLRPISGKRRVVTFAKPSKEHKGTPQRKVTVPADFYRTHTLWGKKIPAERLTS